ncbi:MAG: hypothetical protein KDJ65_37255, partial [Anaerolineae bacterium]|nr:hypothetical protein [Anaerolineae bacterium]
WPVNSLARLFLDQAIIYFVEADLASAQILAGESIQLALKHNLLDTVFEARYIAGITSYLCNDLEMAETHLLAMVEHPVLMDDALAHATCTLSRLYQAQGQPEKANAIIQQIRSYLEEANNSFSLNLLESFQIELALDQGDVVRASRLSLTIPFNQQRPIRYHYYLPQLPPLKLWLAEGQELEQALTLLEEIDGHLCKMNRKVHRIDVLALQALAYQALDDVPMAMEKLGQSVALAAPGKFIRNYLDLGPKMRMLLEQLYNRTKKVDGTKYLPYLSQLVDAFPPVKAEEQKSVSPPSILIDHLTERELQTLGLLATDLSTKEIAAEMNVTWATTRTHIKNIYGKLGVHGRYEAVQHAQKMGLL